MMNIGILPNASFLLNKSTYIQGLFVSSPTSSLSLLPFLWQPERYSSETKSAQFVFRFLTCLPKWYTAPTCILSSEKESLVLTQQPSSLSAVGLANQPRQLLYIFVVGYNSKSFFIVCSVVSQAVRFPRNTYVYMLDLLAKKMDNPLVQRFIERFPFYNMVEDPSTGYVQFQ